MNAIWILVKKELRRVFKDRKMIFSLFVFPALIVVGIYTLIGNLSSSMMDDVDAHIPMVYMANVPAQVEELMKATGYQDMATITYVSEEEARAMEGQVKNESVELVVIFEQNFYNLYQSYQGVGDDIPKVEMYYTTSGNYSSQARSVFEQTILSPLRTNLLQERFGELEALQVFTADSISIDEEGGAAAEILAMMMPYFITMMLFASVMGLGVDAIAGEKERGTMAILLLAPVKRYKIAWGKILSLAILASISACVYAAAMLFSLPNMMESMMQDAISSYHLTIMQVITLMLIMISMVLLFVSMVSIVAVYARTQKEAQSYMAPLYIIVILAGLMTMFQGGQDQPLKMFAIPLYGNALVIQKIIMNELTLSQFFVTFGVTICAAFLLIAGITKAFNNEKVMFHA